MFGKVQVPVYIQENGKGAFFRASNLQPGTYSIMGASFKVEIKDEKPQSKKRKRRTKKEMAAAANALHQEMAARKAAKTNAASNASTPFVDTGATGDTGH